MNRIYGLALVPIIIGSELIHDESHHSFDHTHVEHSIDPPLFLRAVTVVNSGDYVGTFYSIPSALPDRPEREAKTADA
jgi:hypothetical protein